MSLPAAARASLDASGALTCSVISAEAKHRNARAERRWRLRSQLNRLPGGTLESVAVEKVGDIGRAAPGLRRGRAGVRLARVGLAQIAPGVLLELVALLGALEPVAVTRKTNDLRHRLLEPLDPRLSDRRADCRPANRVEPVAEGGANGEHGYIVVPGTGWVA